MGRARQVGPPISEVLHFIILPSVSKGFQVPDSLHLSMGSIAHCLGGPSPLRKTLKTTWSTHKAKSSLRVVWEEIKRTQVLW